MKQNSPLDTVYFITLGEDFKFSEQAMHIDPSIPLPVQKKDKDAPGTFNMAELTEEQILAGLLTVMAYDSDNKNILYYRSLLKKARPNLKAELTEAAILKTKNEDFELAEEIFASLRGFDPEDIATILNTALFLDQRGDFYRQSGLTDDADACDEEALFYYKQAMDAEPAVPDAFFNAGFFYLKKRNFVEAKSVFETYLALTCEESDEDMGENGVYKKNRAQEILNDIANRSLEDEHFSAAYRLIDSDKIEEGLEEIRLFITKNPHVWNAWFMLGWGLRKAGRFEEALKAFEKALSLEGDKTADTYNELAICCMEQNLTDEAKKYLLQALSMEPENTKIISNLGYVALKQGDPSLAASYFQTVLEYDPDDKIAALELQNLDV